jgi:hypothetical protein
MLDVIQLFVILLDVISLNVIIPNAAFLSFVLQAVNL